MIKKHLRPIIAIGDAHGEYYAFAAVLIHAGLMDPELNWTGGKTILVQSGDILDRGDSPLQIDNLLDILQVQARAAGGDIIRIIGNHELEILRKNFFITSLPYFQVASFRSKLINGVLSGKWCAAYSARGFLFTHAGVCDTLYALIREELPGEKPTEAKMAAHINEIFRESVESGHYRHHIFNVSYIRGGSDRFGGIFWEDFSSLLRNHQLCPFRQVIGHTTVSEVVMASDKKIIAIDVGMNKVFSGGFEYLKINGRADIKVCRAGK